MSPTQIPNRYRTVVELSDMMNNDEYVIYGRKFLTIQDYQEEIDIITRHHSFWKTDHFLHEGPAFVFSRPIFEEEVLEGLNPGYQGALSGEPNHYRLKLTRILDSFYKLIQSFQWRSFVFQGTKEDNYHSAVIYIIASEYYDCMSAGMSGEQITILRLLVKKLNINLDLPVYPQKTGDYIDEKKYNWATLKQWMEETEKVFEKQERKILDYFDPVALLPPRTTKKEKQ